MYRNRYTLGDKFKLLFDVPEQVLGDLMTLQKLLTTHRTLVVYAGRKLRHALYVTDARRTVAVQDQIRVVEGKRLTTFATQRLCGEFALALPFDRHTVRRC